MRSFAQDLLYYKKRDSCGKMQIKIPFKHGLSFVLEYKDLVEFPAYLDANGKQPLQNRT